jgi:hypothetical protein
MWYKNFIERRPTKSKTFKERVTLTSPIPTALLPKFYSYLCISCCDGLITGIYTSSLWIQLEIYLPQRKFLCNSTRLSSTKNRGQFLLLKIWQYSQTLAHVEWEGGLVKRDCWVLSGFLFSRSGKGRESAFLTSQVDVAGLKRHSLARGLHSFMWWW